MHKYETIIIFSQNSSNNVLQHCLFSQGEYDIGFLYHCAFSSEQQEKDPETRQDEPFDVIPIEDADETPIHCITFW